MASLESLIHLQSLGLRVIGEPTAPRPNGIQQGSVLVVLDANKAISPAAIYWALANVVRRGDSVKILGIITYVANNMGFMVRVDQSSRTALNVMGLQFEIATKKELIWRTSHMKDWCLRSGVKLDIDVKVGNNPKVIAVDEAKSIGALHVILEKHMKKDRKYFIDNLSCFVSRLSSSGEVETIRSFATSNMLPPMAPTTPKESTQAGHQSKASMGSNVSHRLASSMSSSSFELGGESSDGEFSFHESDHLSSLSTCDSMDQPIQFPIRTSPPKQSPSLCNLRGLVLGSGDIGYVNNPLRKPTVHKWLNEDNRINVSQLHHQGSLTPRTEFLYDQRPLTPRTPELRQSKMGRHSLTTTLRTQASFNNSWKNFRPHKMSVDLLWPLMHWAESRGSAESRPQQYLNTTILASILASNNSKNNSRTAVRRRVSVQSGLNYSDMVESD
ncbi:uncharacterized protein [Physcomitrium patens]|uniref:uncharacterized protein isoform X3 n=1 Tax=Physcomitrium patens TaxID=3218 RepID=UPI000D159DB8|nr:uncharacterized protein LOC112290173 isoform X3 [Physcomitrium patens]|eukprot:XP_024391959.1 uncharacterized protein LOC112290173 isoform X3 [Physcomitrella patens]